MIFTHGASPVLSHHIQGLLYILQPILEFFLVVHLDGTEYTLLILPQLLYQFIGSIKSNNKRFTAI